MEGKWNGVKYAKYSTGGHTVFTETKKLLVIRRKVGWKNRTEYESHCLCKAVSLDLNIRDVDAAIEARHKREERQRAEARGRNREKFSGGSRLFTKMESVEILWVRSRPVQ
uniref:Uncharacterized protein n=1 Tax=Phocoena sinus TaxID=42100 RepID=A0A8C9BS75_PHOSS